MSWPLAATILGVVGIIAIVVIVVGLAETRKNIIYAKHLGQQPWPERAEADAIDQTAVIELPEESL